jgi:hypothetical protein
MQDEHRRETPTSEEEELADAIQAASGGALEARSLGWLLERYRNARRNRESFTSRLLGCECALNENHAGRCQGADCYCH